MNNGTDQSQPVGATTTGASTALVFGVLCLVVLVVPFGVLASPVFAVLAWKRGNREIREIEAGARSQDDLSKAKTGRLLGIIGTAITCFLVVGIALLLLLASGGAMNG